MPLNGPLFREQGHYLRCWCSIIEIGQSDKQLLAWDSLKRLLDLSQLQQLILGTNQLFVKFVPDCNSADQH